MVHPNSLANLQRNGRRKASRNKARSARERVRSACERASGKAVATLRRLMVDTEAPAHVRLAACREIMDRAVGRPQRAGKIVSTGQREGAYAAARLAFGLSTEGDRELLAERGIEFIRVVEGEE